MIKIKLTIPEPCHEDWAKMTPTEQGKFCGSCQKEVFDMTSTSEDEAVNKIHNSKGELCVRIPNQFLNKKIELHAAGFGKYGKLGTAGAIITAAAFTPIISDTNTDLSELAKKNSIQINAIQPIQVSGTVVNENGDIIQNVQITIEQNNHRATLTSLANGRFSFQLDPMKIKNGTAKIKLEKAGFLTQEKEITLDGNHLNGKFVMNINPDAIKICALNVEDITPLIKEEYALTLGQVAIKEEMIVTEERHYVTAGAMVHYVYEEVEITPTTTYIDTVHEKNKLNVDVEPIDINSIKVFPNPTVDNATIEMKKAGNYTVYVFDLNGKMVLNSSFSSTKKQIDLTNFERGNYIIKVLDNDTQEAFDSKVVLMR